MMLASFLALLDKVRRGAGQALDVADPGPVEAPFRIAIELSGAWLGAHQPPGTAPRGPILLIIPAPVKRAYIWDLLPEVSVVRHCLRRGLRVYLLEWLDPPPAENHLGVADRSGRRLRARESAASTRSGAIRTVRNAALPANFKLSVCHNVSSSKWSRVPTDSAAPQGTISI